ncbi:hypothetical protein WG66_003222 [Moniliophthora roreri]|nr:hypothetical protein WG66_003222 [Moniliophthora roreri]
MDPFSMDTMHNLWLDTYLFDGIVAFLVQIYFARRIYMLLSTTKLKLLSGIIVLLSITQFAGAIGASIGVKKIVMFSNFGQSSSTPGYFWIFGGTLADMLIAVTMVYALSQYDTTVRQTRNLVRRLKRLALETGSITAIVAPMVPLFYFCFPDQNYHVVPAVVIAKLYSNSLLVIFNSRIRIYGTGVSSEVASRQRTSISVTTNSNSRV